MVSLLRPFGVALLIGALIFAVSTSVQADEIWIPPTSQQEFGGLGVASNIFWPVTPVGAVRFAWSVPDNLQSLQGAKVAIIPGAPAGGPAALHFYVCAAENGSGVLANCTGPFSQTFTSAENLLTEVEIGGVLGQHVGTPGSTYLAVLAYTTPAITTDHIVGLRFSYIPTTPSGAATLAANTFTGTQTAPQFNGTFVGDGSGLTNLPVPSGVATLGTNTFSGMQVAPAFVGDGAGLANVAKLGVNLFTGTQTINAGNLELEPSTSSSGSVTKNGTPFLHNVGQNNTFLGLNAGNFNGTPGVNNTAVGFEAMRDSGVGGGNTAVGASALATNGLGSINTAVGVSALGSNTIGYYNNAVGFNALGSNTTGHENLASGVASLVSNTTGSHNTAVGLQTLANNTSGEFNVAVGRSAGASGTTGSNNIYLGSNVVGAAGESNTMYLGKVGTQTKTIIAGVRGITTANPDPIPVVIDSAGQLGTAPGSFATLGPNTYTGTQTAPAFVGDGSGLTNLPPGGIVVVDSNGAVVGPMLTAGAFQGGVNAVVGRRVGSQWVGLQVGPTSIIGSSVNFYYESTDCTGTPYLLLQTLPAAISVFDGQSYFPAAPFQTPTLNSVLNVNTPIPHTCQSAGLSVSAGVATPVDLSGIVPPFDVR